MSRWGKREQGPRGPRVEPQTTQQRAGLFDGLTFGPWTYTCIRSGRRLTYKATHPCEDGCAARENGTCPRCGDGYHVVLDGRFDAETAKQWVGHVERKRWVTEVAVRELRKALRQALGLKAKEEPTSQPEPDAGTSEDLEPEDDRPT